MDWRVIVARFAGELERLLNSEQPAKMLAAGGLALLAVMFATAALVARYRGRRPRRRLVEAAAVGPAAMQTLLGSDKGDWGATHTEPTERARDDAPAEWPIDRVLPRRLHGTLLVTLGIALGVWLGGLYLAPDVARFLSAREWHFQPFYIAAHIMALRLFVLAYTRGFERGVAHLTVPEAQVSTLVRRVLGFRGALSALLIAAPFATLDFLYLYSSRYERMGGPDTVLPIDYMMWGIWSVEWFVNAFIWVIILGFLIKTCWVIQRYPFRQPIEIVLHDRQYRPFLQMSAQGASIVLVFTVVTVAYIAYTGGELTDYAGLAITATLLVIGFVPSLVLMRAKVRRAVEAETLSMRRQLIRSLGQAETDVQAAHVNGQEPRASRLLEHRLDAAVSILRISYLENRNQDLGQSETRAILVRMAAPAVSIAWQMRNHLSEAMQYLPAPLLKLLQ